jgi:hypothetical protein
MVSLKYSMLCAVEHLLQILPPRSWFRRSPFPPIADDVKAPVMITDTGPALSSKEAVRW